MSIKLMALVWEYQFTHPEQSIMLALADHAHDDGSNVYPSVAYLSWKTDYSERQVQRILRDLEAKNILTPVRHRGGGRGFATEYSLHIEKGDKKSPFQKKGDIQRKKGDIYDKKGDEDGIKGDMATSPQPSLEPSLEPTEPDARARDFKAMHPRLWEEGCSGVTDFIRTVGRGPWDDEEMNVVQWRARK